MVFFFFFLHNRDTILAGYASWKKISPSEFVSNGYISNHNKVRRPRPNSKSPFFCCFWINATQINFENIKEKIQRIISDSCFQLKSRFNVDARAPSIPLLNFPFKCSDTKCDLKNTPESINIPLWIRHWALCSDKPHLHFKISAPKLP